ncbi:membrane protein insertion efficiency factor YidD [Patescibacteria group bacterium]|nr:membrane protein insertion efficiency factor YidD [Patescibacteria group bacterium]MBU1890961.1 membrane protein insertion efficiency factor YidD [Patescibacteria group bacterium]
MLKLGKIITLRIIKLYQTTLSPDHGVFSGNHPMGYCKYHPTCSEYTYQAIDRYGVFRGGCKGLIRLLRCNPFSKGGSDPLL